ncbi:hypothetical protein [Candidatus Palauibacter sp.]
MANHHTRAVPEIDDAQRVELERWLRRSRTGQALAQHLPPRADLL